MDHRDHRCGFVAIVGRPNVGKSTLLNCLVGQKVSITSRRPQTTRHRIMGIKTTPAYQVIYVDTPGMHQGRKNAMNRYLNRAARSAMADVDALVFVVEGVKWTDEDELVLQRLREIDAPVILVINKVDQVDKAALLAHIAVLAGRMDFAAVVPLSARSGQNVDALESEVQKRLPPGPSMFPEEQVSDRSDRFLAAEIVREKLTRRLGQELPHALTVEIDRFRERNRMVHIDAVIWVEREGQKAIVIGKDGSGLKVVGQQARHDLERLFGRQVFIRLWVKVKAGWSSDERSLRSLGYKDE